jgi:hypothetical protein
MVGLCLMGASLVVVTGTAGSAAASAAGSARPPVRTGPFLRATRPPGVRATTTCPGCSFNWAGYAQVATHRHTFTEVTDTFVVPTVTSSIAGQQVAADWVGIGGYNDPTLVQAGIETTVATANNQTTTTYNAWTEILPQNESTLPMTISAGDTVTVTVQETALNRWLMEVQDGAQISSRAVRYRARGLSVEAIHERPCVAAPCSDADHLASLAQTSNVIFGPGSFSETAPGLTPVPQPLLGAVRGFTLHNLTMVSDDGSTVVATSSPPDTGRDAFAVADGSATPPAPTI